MWLSSGLRDQPRQERLDAVDGTPQIDVDDEAPIVVAGLGDRARVGDARVVEHHVHVVEHPERLIGEVHDVVELADVADHAVHVDPVVAQVCDRIVQRGLVDVRQHQAGTAARELFGGGETDSARSAGDDCCAPVVTVHGADLMWSGAVCWPIP